MLTISYFRGTYCNFPAISGLIFGARRAQENLALNVNFSILDPFLALFWALFWTGKRLTSTLLVLTSTYPVLTPTNPVLTSEQFMVVRSAWFLLRAPVSLSF